MNIREQTIRSIKWQVISSMAQKALSFVTAIIIARHLGPSIYGIFGLALIIVTSFEVFKSLGVDAALVRIREDAEKAADTAFIIIPTLGIVLYIILFFFASYIGDVLNNQLLIPVIRHLGLVFVFSCFSRVPAAILERNLQFTRLSIAEFIGSIIFSATAIILVYKGFYIKALVYAYVARTLTYCILVWINAKWLPRLSFNWKIAIEMSRFGKFVLFSSAVWFIKMNLDNFMVGKLLGTVMLGLYAIAFNIANFGNEYLGSKFYRVIYPAYSKIRDNPEQLRRGVLTSFKLLALIGFLLSIGTFFLGSEFLVIAYGEKWRGAVPALKILAWLGILNLIPVNFDGLFLSIGHPKISFWNAAIQVGMFFALLVPAANHAGIAGVAGVVVFAALAGLLFELFWTKRLLGINFGVFFLTIKPILVASVMSAIVMLAAAMLEQSIILPPWINFLAKVILMLLTFITVLHLADRKIIAEVKSLIKT